MTIGKLINRLKTYNLDYEVEIFTDDGILYVFVDSSIEDKIVDNKEQIYIKVV